MSLIFGLISGGGRSYFNKRGLVRLEEPDISVVVLEVPQSHLIRSSTKYACEPKLQNASHSVAIKVTLGNKIEMLHTRSV